MSASGASHKFRPRLLSGLDSKSILQPCVKTPAGAEGLTLDFDSTARTTRQSTKGRSRVNYDAKLHPADESMRPANWRKRQGAASMTLDDEKPVLECTYQPDEETSEEEVDASQLLDSASIKGSKLRQRDPRATRFSQRPLAQHYKDYRRMHHPQDEFIPGMKRTRSRSQSTTRPAKAQCSRNSREKFEAFPVAAVIYDRPKKLSLRAVEEHARSLLQDVTGDTIVAAFKIPLGDCDDEDLPMDQCKTPITARMTGDPEPIVIPSSMPTTVVSTQSDSISPGLAAPALGLAAPAVPQARMQASPFRSGHGHDLIFGQNLDDKLLQFHTDGKVNSAQVTDQDAGGIHDDCGHSRQSADVGMEGLDQVLEYINREVTSPSPVRLERPTVSMAELEVRSPQPVNDQQTEYSNKSSDRASIEVATQATALLEAGMTSEAPSPDRLEQRARSSSTVTMQAPEQQRDTEHGKVDMFYSPSGDDEEVRHRRPVKKSYARQGGAKIKGVKSGVAKKKG